MNNGDDSDDTIVASLAMATEKFLSHVHKLEERSAYGLEIEKVILDMMREWDNDISFKANMLKRYLNGVAQQQL